MLYINKIVNNAKYDAAAFQYLFADGNLSSFSGGWGRKGIGAELRVFSKLVCILCVARALEFKAQQGLFIRSERRRRWRRRESKNSSRYANFAQAKLIIIIMRAHSLMHVYTYACRSSKVSFIVISHTYWEFLNYPAYYLHSVVWACRLQGSIYPLRCLLDGVLKSTNWNFETRPSRWIWIYITIIRKLALVHCIIFLTSHNQC